MSAPKSPFVTSFLPGLVVGLAVGAFAAAILVPMLSANEMKPLPAVKAGTKPEPRETMDPAPVDGVVPGSVAPADSTEPKLADPAAPTPDLAPVVPPTATPAPTPGSTPPVAPPTSPK